MGARPGEAARCLSCAALLTDDEPVCPTCGEPTAPPERRVVTVLFADLSGYTELCARLDPEDVHAFVRPAMTALRRLVESFGGSVPQVLGDGFMAVFGAPTAHEDDAERAVRAGLALIDEVERLNREARIAIPGIHVGVNTGELLIAASRELGGFSVAGDAVNVAARLCAVARTGQVLVGPRTAELTEHAVLYAAPRQRRLKGVADPLPVHAARSLRPVPAPVAGRVAAAFVGRSAELERLTDELAAVVAEGRSRLVLVRGEAGYGKSRLVAELASAAAAQLLVARCRAYGDALPTTPLAEAVAAAAGASVFDPPEVRAAAFAALLVGAGVEDPAGLPDRLDAALSGALDGAGADALRANVAAVRAAVEALARTTPVLLVVEDLHWAGAELVEALADVAEQGWAGPVLVVATGRPETAVPAGAVVLDLDALDRASMQSMLGDLVGAPPGERMSRDLLQRAGGNPLYLEECVRLLQAQGALLQRSGTVVADQGSLDQIPQTMRMFIAARLDGLEPDVRSLVQDASVVGDLVWDAALREIRGGDVGPLLDRAVAAGVLRVEGRSTVPGAVAYRFKHALLREVAYESLPRRGRAVRHRVVAEWVAATSGDRPAPAVLGVLAHHYERAWSQARSEAGGRPPCDLARAAVDHLLEWGRHQRGYQARAAASSLGHALAICEEAPDCLDAGAHAAVRVQLARARDELGDHDGAAALAEQAQAHAAAAGLTALQAEALLARALASSNSGRIREAGPLFEVAQAQAAEAGELRLEADVAHLAVLNRRYDGLMRLVPDLRAAYDLYQRAGDRDGMRSVAQRLAYWLTIEGGPEFERWYDLARSLVSGEDLRGRAELRRTEAFVSWYRGDVDRAVRAAQETVAAAYDAGARFVEADGLSVLVAMLPLLGRLENAESALVDLLSPTLVPASPHFQALARTHGAQVASRRGDAALAEERLHEAAEILHSVGRAEDLVEIDQVRAVVLLQRGDWARARSLAEAGVLDSQERGQGLYGVSSHVVAGRAGLGAGDPDAAERLADAVAAARRHDAAGYADLGAVCLEQAQLLHGDVDSPVLRAATVRHPEAAAVAAENEALRSWRDDDFRAAAAALRQAVDRWAALGVTVWLARAAAWRAQVLDRTGGADEAAEQRKLARRVLADLTSPLGVDELGLG